MVPLRNIQPVPQALYSQCYVSLDDEAYQYQSYHRHLKIAKQLEQKRLHRDAFIALHLAVECFLKHIYCLVRYQNQLAGGAPFPQVSAKNFNHRVREIAEFLETHVPEFKASKEFGALRRNTEKSPDWINWRYRQLIQYDKKCKSMYLALLPAFERSLRTIFGGLR